MAAVLRANPRKVEQGFKMGGVPPSLIFAVVNKVGKMLLVKKSANGDKTSVRDISIVKIVVLVVAALAAYFLGGSESAIEILSQLGDENE